tara:strand:- start:1106 stop:1270 length:165 start_codon:yes stop_codon:yes gene_type:complete
MQTLTILFILSASLTFFWGCSKDQEPAKIDLKEDQNELPGADGKLPEEVEKKRQ